MSSLTRTLGLAAGVALLAAACGSTATSSSPGASSTFPNVSPSAGVGGASATPEMSGGTLPSASPELSGGTGATGGTTGGTGMTGDQLMAAIPTTIGTTTLTVRTATAADLPFFDGPTGAVVLSSLGTALGVDPSRMTAAIGTSADQSLTVGALDVPGTDSGKLRMALPPALSTLGASGVGTPTVIGGRTVSVFSPDTGTAYVYPSGSTIYVIKATDKALADQALAAIPE